MTPEEEAYALAEERIAEAKANGSKLLNLSSLHDGHGLGDEVQHGASIFRHLANVPTSINELSALELFSASKTEIRDISILSELKNLRFLYAFQTHIDDIDPLIKLYNLRTVGISATFVNDINPVKSMKQLQRLWITSTLVEDLSPVIDLKDLTDLRFQNTPAARSSRELSELSEIDNNKERTQRTLDWLGARRDANPIHLKPKLNAAALPDQDEELQVTESEGTLEVREGTPAPQEAADPLRQKLYKRLRENVEELARKAGNTHGRLAGRTTRLRTCLGTDLARADLVDVYLEVEELRLDLAQDNDARDLPYEPDLLVLMELTIRNAGGLVIGTKQIDEIEARGQQMLAGGPVENKAESAKAVARKIVEDESLFGQRLRAYLGITLEGGSDGRLATVQQVLSKNSILAAGVWVLLAAGGGFVGNVATELVGAQSAAQWIVGSSAELQAMAASWSEWAGTWLLQLIDEARQVLATIDGSTAAQSRDPRKK